MSCTSKFLHDTFYETVRISVIAGRNCPDLTWIIMKFDALKISNGTFERTILAVSFQSITLRL